MFSFRSLLFLSLLFVQGLAFAQNPFEIYRDQTIPVYDEQGQSMVAPWIGGLNAVLYNEVDLDLDGTMDLMIYDRSGGKVLPFINGGTPNQIDYTYAPEYEENFPPINSWVTMGDLNCDGKNDLVTYQTGGMRVYRNTSNTQDGLQFELYIPFLTTFDDYFNTNVSLGSSSVEVPALADINGDGYTDIFTIFSNTGNTVAYHKNVSVEQYGTCDTMAFETRNHCWGQFYISAAGNVVGMNTPCNWNVSNPELDELMEEANADYDGRRQEQYTEEAEERNVRDGAHSILVLDNNDNGVQDMLIGHDHFFTLTMLTNGGTLNSSLITNQEILYPTNTEHVYMDTYPTMAYMDVDNDGTKDLLVSVFYELWTQNDSSSWFYKNVGTDTQPLFELQTKTFVQDWMIEVGYGSQPVFFDNDGDGLKDLLVGNFDYWQPGTGAAHPSQIALFKNVGTASAPAFQRITKDWNGMSNVGLAHGLSPTFGDLDGDGDLDMMVGDSVGNLHYYENTSPVGDSAVFALAQGNLEDTDNMVIDVGRFCVPQLFDIDRDNDLDLLVGERDGNINYYWNIGDANNYAFKFYTDTMGDVSTTEWWNTRGHSQPYFFEHDNEYWLISGSLAGGLFLYNDVENNLLSTFNLVDSMAFGIDPGAWSKVVFEDITNDGVRDLMVGNARGGLSFYRGGIYDAVEEVDRAQLEFNLYPNPTQGSLTLQWREAVLRPVDLTVVSITGQVVLQEQIVPGRQQELDVSNLNAGIYLITITVDGVQTTQRFVRSK